MAWTFDDACGAETLESLFVMYRQTGDRKYQDWAWSIFQVQACTPLQGQLACADLLAMRCLVGVYQAIDNHCWTPTAYSGLLDVTRVPPEQNDSMQSFFLAETLKYLYLIFSPTTVLPQSQYVFNTEAHPFPIFQLRADA